MMTLLKKINWQWVSDGMKALSAIPISLYIVGVTCIIAFSSWPTEVANIRIQYLGMALLASLAVLALSLFLVREGIKSFYVKNGIVEVGMNRDEDEDENEQR